jgi:hypothetical protein
MLFPKTCRIIALSKGYKVGFFRRKINPGAQAMNYQEFRDLWHDALQAARLQIPYPIGPTERINLRDMSRSYELIIYGGANPKCEPFHLTATITWNWDAVLSARYETTEEDMLMQIFGDFGIHDDDTVPPRLRMDVSLSAGVVYGTVYPMPALTSWQRWVRQASDEMQALLPTGYEEDGAICATSDPIQASVKLLDDGQLGLERVTFKAWQVIRLPRQWDDPEKSDPYPEEALFDLASRIAKALNALENSLACLVKGEV